LNQLSDLGHQGIKRRVFLISNICDCINIATKCRYVMICYSYLEVGHMTTWHNVYTTICWAYAHLAYNITADGSSR